MKRTRRPKSGETTYHRDDTVTVWDCLQQSWVRGSDPSDELYATMGEPERSRVSCHVAG